MGRGRAKAKQQKVARDLKYNTQMTDLASLQRELGGGTAAPTTVEADPFDDEDDEDGPAAAAR
jgi:hypothetical protein